MARVAIERGPHAIERGRNACQVGVYLAAGQGFEDDCAIQFEPRVALGQRLILFDPAAYDQRQQATLLAKCIDRRNTGGPLRRGDLVQPVEQRQHRILFDPRLSLLTWYIVARA